MKVAKRERERERVLRELKRKVFERKGRDQICLICTTAEPSYTSV
jgi:hypothetical protein